MTCQDCGAPLTYRGTGRKPRFCAQHQKGASAMRRLRAKGGANRPLCCASASPALKCEQHKEEEAPWRFADHWADYAGALPRMVRRECFSFDDETAGEMITPDMTMPVATLASEDVAAARGMSLRVDVSSAARKPPSGQWIKEQFTDGSGAIPVIGQRDVDADWQPVEPAWRDSFGERIGSTGFKASAPTALLPRGAAWPWADATA